VSPSTVSRVVNNKHAGKVSEATRTRILEVARAMHYQPNPQAVALATGRPPNTLGLVIPYYSHTFRSFYFSEISSGVLDTAGRHRIDVNLLVHHDDTTEGYRRLVSGNRVAGVVLFGGVSNETAISACRAAGVPFVVVNRDSADRDVPSVGSDNEGGGYDATRHLIRLGHTRIAFITGPAGRPDADGRYQGYRRAMEEAGLSVVPGLVAQGDYSEKGGREAMRQLLAQSPRPTALFAANDQSAIAAMAVIKRAGLRVPQDIAVVGFDDIPLAQHVEPALTTIHQPTYRMGQRAAEMLMASIGADGAGLNESEEQILRTRLVVRESCGARRSPDAETDQAIRHDTPAGRPLMS
jgi:LacI family transcriptional regulator